MISRNYQELVWQHTDLEDLVCYVDNLKSRIYEAFSITSHFKAYYLQSYCINSSLVIALALKVHLKFMRVNLSPFELGYLLVAISNNFCLDVSFFYSYKERFGVDAAYLFQGLIEQAKRLVLDWSICPYQAYLSNEKKYACKRVSNLIFIDSFAYNQLLKYNYSMRFNTDICLRYIDPSILIKRISISKNIKRYLLRCFSQKALIASMSHFILVLRYLSLAKNSSELSVSLLNILVSYICREIRVVTSSSFAFSDHVKTFTCIYSGTFIMAMSKDPAVIQVFAKKLRDFLVFNGIKLTNGPSLHLPLVTKDVSMNLGSTVFRDRFSFFHSETKASFGTQYDLIKRISDLLTGSISQPLFLLVIRLNKLLCLYANIGMHADYKILYLIDYLITLKMRLFAKKHSVRLYNLDIVLCALHPAGAINRDSGYSSNLILGSIFDNNFCKYYISVKIFWLYRIKCLSN